MFELFTQEARFTVVRAQEEARAFKHNYIGTEHILLGLLRVEEGLAARVLGSFNVTVEGVRGQVATIVGEGYEAADGQIPFTPRAKKVLELSLREALSLGHNYIGPEHILLGLVNEDAGIAAEILLSFEADANSVRDEMIRILSGPDRHRSSGGLPTMSDDMRRALTTAHDAIVAARGVASSANDNRCAAVIGQVEQLLAILLKPVGRVESDLRELGG